MKGSKSLKRVEAMILHPHPEPEKKSQIIVDCGYIDATPENYRWLSSKMFGNRNCYC